MMLHRCPQHRRIRGEALQHDEPVRQTKDRHIRSRLLMLDVVEQLLPDEDLILHRRIERIDKQDVQRGVWRNRRVVGEDAGWHRGYRRPGFLIRCGAVLFEVADRLRLLLLGQHEAVARQSMDGMTASVLHHDVYDDELRAGVQRLRRCLRRFWRLRRLLALCDA